MKFKNTKPFRPKKPRAPRKSKEEKAKKRQFPKIYLKIPEKKAVLRVLRILRRMAIIFVFAVILVLILFTSANLYRHYIQNRQIQNGRQKLVHEINTWKSFAGKYSSYKEVYFQIAVREYQLGDFASAQNYLQKSLYIDPGYEEALKLQKELEGK
jgi:tetratricopeptide (TPR) repeat protein